MVSRVTQPDSAERPGNSQPFVLFDGAVRGRLVRLNGVAETILRRHNYPDTVSQVLSEAMAAAAALADTLKFDGSFTLQIQSNGPVHTLVTDITSERALRGCAKFHAEELDGRAGDSTPNLMHVLGQGHVAFTVDQGPDMDRYQGIVELAGAGIGDCIHQYFRQSEQLETAIKVVAGKTADAAWQAAAIMVQRMPDEGGHIPTESEEDAWRSAVILLSSVTDAELLNSELTEEDVLRRLFGTVGGRLLAPHSIAVGCRCSRERSEKILASFPMEEIRDMSVDGVVSMTCEFCNIDFDFTKEDLNRMEKEAETLRSAPAS